ncbi:uncharacterized protein BXZ73DRAFT_48070 [Epithele typhae]|uniref:uncharacterized protein n=1 Tax=Epithele typhae TaxID=378194 RepID=UPI0020080935|nr:uncharacterized protein BXZ73DRAFT_48070 [Epithele typhae]KAH9929554.1 hypothetical protein BXZ73DRAFT_48070 [Epithele typhae]
MARQSPTITKMAVRNVHDAEILLHAVKLKILPMVVHRLGDEERLALRSGCIYVWEERSSNPHEATGQEIQRFTEGRSWGPSRAKDNFLIYYEKASPSRTSVLLRTNPRAAPQLVKQTYSVYIDYPRNTRKWHLNAYYTKETYHSLNTIDDYPELASIQVPINEYVCARNNGARSRTRALTFAPPALALSDSGPSPPPSPPSSNSSTSSLQHSHQHQDAYPFPPTPAVDPHGHRAQHQPKPALSETQSAQNVAWRLAPLEYLQNLAPAPRDPADETALRQLQYGRGLD